jgi:hypothetical protein
MVGAWSRLFSSGAMRKNSVIDGKFSIYGPYVMDYFPSIAILKGQTWKIVRVIFHLFKMTVFHERFSTYSDIRGETWKIRP